jgi:hypothetical protein
MEMAHTSQEFDVVVIDEIQMMSDPYRGFAWSRALMGRFMSAVDLRLKTWSKRLLISAATNCKS